MPPPQLSPAKAHRFAWAIRSAFRRLLDPGPALECRTIREAVDAVASRLNVARERQPPLASQALARVRQALGQTDIGRSHSLEQLLPVEDRRFLWRKLKEELGGWLPHLRTPMWFEWMFGFAIAMIGTAAGTTGGSWGSGVLGAVAGGIAMWIASAPMRTRLPKGMNRVADLVDEMVCRPVRIKEAGERWSREQVEEVFSMLALRRIELRGLDSATELPAGTLIG